MRADWGDRSTTCHLAGAGLTGRGPLTSRGLDIARRREARHWSDDVASGNQAESGGGPTPDIGRSSEAIVRFRRLRAFTCASGVQHRQGLSQLSVDVHLRPGREIASAPRSIRCLEFVVSFGRLLPLQRPSPFGDKDMIQKLMACSGGLTGKITTLLARAAELAIRRRRSRSASH
jgi:hypothetical protein